MMQSNHSGAGERSFGEGWMEIEVIFITDKLNRGCTSMHVQGQYVRPENDAAVWGIMFLQCSPGTCNG